MFDYMTCCPKVHRSFVTRYMHYILFLKPKKVRIPRHTNYKELDMGLWTNSSEGGKEETRGNHKVKR